ncbi:MAG: hypothetical protein NUV47_01595 [Patescibacteria group bacterium]|nr:hypothetical protein [Patescibacteria group bacterium]
MDEQKIEEKNVSYPFQRPLRTYESDVADTIKSKNVSVTKIAIAEKIKKEKNDLTSPIPPSPLLKNISLFFISLILVVSGLYAIYEFYYVPKSKVIVINKTVVPNIIVSDIDKEVTIETINSETNNLSIPENSIANLYITKGEGDAKKLISAQEFLSLLQTDAPDQYVRTLEPDFMFGIHSFNGNNPFIIFKTNLYQSAFAGMLKWEATLANDLSVIFSTTAQPTPDILATSKPFIDLVIKNKDVRALTNQYDRITLLYTFLDKETLLITTNEFTLKEILNRITNKKFVQ